MQPWSIVQHQLPARMVNGLHLYSAFLTSGHSKRFTVSPHIHLLLHIYTNRRRSQPHKATASSLGAARVRHLAQAHLNTQLGGAGDQTSNLPVTSQPALPPETNAAPRRLIVMCVFLASMFCWEMGQQCWFNNNS